MSALLAAETPPDVRCSDDERCSSPRVPLADVRCLTCRQLLGRFSVGAIVSVKCHRCKRLTAGQVQSNGEVLDRAA